MTERIISGFPPTATADEVIAGIDMTGRRVVITGGSSGIGRETARALAGAGAEVTLAVRRRESGLAAAEEIAASVGGARVHVADLDLTKIESVEAFVGEWHGPLDVLVNNAGIMAPPTRQVTDRGVELQFATNHLGHFALALGLHDALAASDAARIVVVSSVAHRRAPVDFDDVNFDHRPYDPWVAYGQSKTATILFAVEADRRWHSDGITANALHPGGINTRLDRFQGDDYHRRLNAQFGGAAHVPWKTARQGAATSVLLAASPLLDGVGGRYFEDLNESAPTSEPLSAQGDNSGGVAPYAVDPANASRLWDLSLRLLSVGSCPATGVSTAPGRVK
ncbi:SDR family NAD(P)-dependent oxidoreductase [Streptomyces sp. NPDC091292]|uniref:SDR family NAD(P)-dependent oxidoreductase n=1 Tax=Streptomyces sp. NPDC091292 TaxID=3365991 RepID=UPI00382C1A4C